ncbi:hypothetical protein [Moraxella lacunata]|uniref:hypothetical protein n=1 Tax=Moraxella lacunata TaxID=477 RepID=UPI003EE05284
MGGRFDSYLYYLMVTKVLLNITQTFFIMSVRSDLIFISSHQLSLFFILRL